MAFYCYFRYACDRCSGDVISRREQIRRQILNDRREAERIQNELEAENRMQMIIEKRKQRRAHFETELKSVTKTLEKGDLVSADDIESGLTFDDDGQTDYFLKLSTDGNETNGDIRYIPANCAVCLDDYEVGDTVVRSTNSDCYHVYHNDCILTWLSKGKKRCPCCRQSFVKKTDDDTKQCNVLIPPGLEDESEGQTNGIITNVQEHVIDEETGTASGRGTVELTVNIISSESSSNHENYDNRTGALILSNNDVVETAHDAGAMPS
eukprot:CAMPEP_0172506604 /NCGR_PEP_ID=MMETSP1066-20121228/196517_1 /TAXON_ID=671091 /ORGANISM="Coscinodiscus wailesii, Strain CCMP2513" /LENGTH=265 /DNA_ID=CAMNT_0013283695 /DNA_START=280 /DNA_END=1077 /DNA_ORIENTATION=+